MEGIREYSDEELNTLRRELEKNMQGRSDALPATLLDQILAQPPRNLCKILRTLAIEFGPLSVFSFGEYINMEDTPSELVRSTAPMVNKTESSLATAAGTLEAYNKFLEQKTGKFKVQTVRSLALMQESSPAIATIPAPGANTTEAKVRKLMHMQKIAQLRDQFDASDKARSLKIEGYAGLYFGEVQLLSLYNEYFNDTFGQHPPQLGNGQIWLKYNSLLKNVDDWTTMIMGRSSVIDSAVVKLAHDLVHQVVTHITDHCKTQLATVYHETASVNTTPQSEHYNAVREEAEALAKEIDWLIEELVPVAHMCVSAQFLRPIISAYEDWETTKKLREATITTYTSGVMRFLNEHLAAVAKRTEILVYHHKALRDASYVRQLKEAGSLDKVPQEMPRTMAQGIHHFRKNATAAENMQYYMKLYGAVPVEVPSLFPRPTPSVLDEYVRNRAQKGDTMLEDLHKLFEAATKAGLTDRELGGELLLESLLADSSPKSGQLGSAYKDSELESSIAVLRSQAKQIQEMFKELNLDGIANASDFVAHAYRQNVERLNAKVGEDCFRRGENKSPGCLNCVRCLRFEEFLRKWGS